MSGKDSPGPTQSCKCCHPENRRFIWVLLAAVVGGVAVALWWQARDEQSPPAAATTPAVAAPSASDWRFLQGRWVRPDGGYVLEIRSVDATGQIEAGYFNPQPIRVSDARASREAGAVKVFVELNDVNYPGCKYNLTYIPDRDILVGTYYQAALRQTYEVGFERHP